LQLTRKAIFVNRLSTPETAEVFCLAKLLFVLIKGTIGLIIELQYFTLPTH